MSASFHSPAPWTVNASGGARTIVARDRSVVAVVLGSDAAAPFEVGNGALLAAAPDLRDALLAIRRKHDRDAAETEPGFICGCGDCVATGAALAKAGSDGR